MLTAWITKLAYIGDDRLSSGQQKIAQQVASLPHDIRIVVLALKEKSTGDPNRLLVRKPEIRSSKWIDSFPCPEDSGFLLFSGLDSSSKKCNIRLIRISDGKVLKVWNPNWDEIEQAARKKSLPFFNGTINPIANHPLPLDDGSIVFNTDGLTIQLGSNADSKAVIVPAYSHHSIERDLEDNWVVTVSAATGFYSDNKYLNRRIIDDSLLRLNLVDHRQENRSFSKILFDNGLDSLIFGHNGIRSISEDLIHLNQIQVAHEDGAMWKRGDQLISARHLSAIFIYRPASNSIIWHKTGPWKNQHSVHFVNQDTIALLDNNVFGYDREVDREKNFVNKKDINRVFVVKFNNGNQYITEPFKELLEMDVARPQTVTQGRIRVLPDGGLFLEETNYGRHLRFGNGKLMWSRINHYDDSRVGYLGWSRYLTSEEGSAFLSKIVIAEKTVPK